MVVSPKLKKIFDGTAPPPKKKTFWGAGGGSSGLKAKDLGYVLDRKNRDVDHIAKLAGFHPK